MTASDTQSDLSDLREVIDVSVVIPCYRDEKGLPNLLARLAPAMTALGLRCELVLVDDGSPDRTGERAVALSSDFPHPVTVVRLARNFGQHPAVFAGLQHSVGKVVVTMDSDLQYPPEEMATLIGALSDEYPVVSGYRAKRKDPPLRRILSRSISWWLGRRTGAKLRDFGSMFRAYDRSVVEQLLQFTEQRRFVPALVSWLGIPVLEVPVKHDPRSDVGSRYRLSPLVDMLLDLVTGYSIFPLRVVTVLGLAGSLAGLGASLVFFAYRLFVGRGASGLVAAVALVFALLAIQLLVLALVGEYVGRVYNETRGRPYFLVRDVVRNR